MEGRRMHLVKVTEEATNNGGVRIYCPYCKTYQFAEQATVLRHLCPDAGFLFFMNGYAWIGVPNYLTEEKSRK
jgi:hypothetical protein